MTDLQTVTQRMDRLFDEMMGRTFRRAVDEGGVRGSWAPAVDILEKKDAIVIRADLPGFKAEDVEVTVDNGVLTIRGERKFEEASQGATYHRVERSFGLFERTFTLPNSVDVSKVEARFKDGEMNVNLPKREELKPRSVKVKVAEE
jgi:HSP20 family protein